MKTNELVGNIAVLQDMLNGATQEQWIALRAAMDALLQVKAFEDGERGKWIPVEDRLPEVHDMVDGEWQQSDEMLVCDSGGLRFLASLEIDAPLENDGEDLKYWTDAGGLILSDIIAWQPLPEAYHKLP